MQTSIETLTQDDRLRVLFKSADADCAVQLWLLQIKKEENIETRLLYGRILPYSFSNNQWSAPKEDSFKSFSDYKAQVIRIHLYCNTNKLIGLVSSLSCRKNILYINSDLELDMSPALQKRFGEFCFVDKLCYRPVSYLPMRDDFDSKGLKSPHGSAGAFSGALTPFGKNALFFNNGEMDNALFSYAVNQINTDTGMSFGKDDVARLGDLELLVFPTLDNRECNLFRVDWKEKGKILNVSLEQNKCSLYDIFFIKTSFTNDHQTVHSSLRTVHQVSGELVSADFELPEYLNKIIDSLSVEIHAQKYNDNSAVLYCQYRVGFIREIGLTLHNVSNSVAGIVKSDWMTKVTKISPSSPRIVATQLINQGTTSSSSVVGGRQTDPWVSINRNAKTQLEKFQPTPSEGIFFNRYKDGDGLGRLEFVEWTKKLLNSNQKHQVIIFDPYFEDVGVSLLVPNASTDSDYIVFTTESKTEQQRRNNLIRCCEQLSLLVNRIRLRIYALPNDAFHDRYILISEKSGESLKGFHLSNSIQKANENFPLLITPIPPDVLIKVNNYALEVIAKETSSPFFDSKALHGKNEARKRYEPLLFLDEKEAGTVLATWSGAQELKNLKSQPLKNRLEQLGFLQGESLMGDKFANCANILSFLANTDSITFNQYWDVTGNILANTPSGDLLDSCEIPDVVTLCDALLIYLKGKVSEESLDTFDAQDAFSYCQRLNDSIDKILHHGRTSNFHHGIKFNAISWADYYAIKILWHHNPNHFLDFIEDSTKLISSNGDYKQKQIKIYSILAQAIDEIALNVEFGLTEAQISLLINRNNAFLKWFGYCALETAIIKNNGLLSIISNMQESDKIMLLGWMINRTAKKDMDQNQLFGSLVKEYLATFPTVLAKDDVTVFINSLRGHMRELGWCEPWLFTQIVMPLIDKDRINFDDLAAIWMAEMEELFNRNLSGQSGVFSVAHEGVTTDIAAYLIAHSSYRCQKGILKSLKKRLEGLSRDIRKPLASTSNWKYWDSILKTVFWIYGLTKWIDDHLLLPNLIQPLLLATVDEAYELSMHRSTSEWEALNYAGGEFSIFLKDRSEFN